MSAPTWSNSSIVVCCGIPLLKKRNTSSVVWDYFGLKAGSDCRVVSLESQVPVYHCVGRAIKVKEVVPKLR